MTNEKTLPPLPEKQYQMSGKGHSDSAMHAYASAALATHAQAQPVVQDGWQWVPIEPTLEMLAELGFGGDVDMLIGHAASLNDTDGYYTALLAAAPQPEPTAPAPAEMPPEPDDAMQLAGAQAIRFETTTLNKMWTANAVYRAMQAAWKARS